MAFVYLMTTIDVVSFEISDQSDFSHTYVCTLFDFARFDSSTTVAIIIIVEETGGDECRCPHARAKDRSWATMMMMMVMRHGWWWTAAYLY